MDVDKVLSEAPKYKSIKVDKDDDLKYDLGCLAAFDFHPLNVEAFKESPTHLLDASRDNIQLLFSQIFQLPTQVLAEGVVVTLPAKKSDLPRAKPLPETREPTRWEKYAKVKGIQPHKRRDKLVWDESTGTFRPRFGRRSIANDPKNTWAVEVSDQKAAEGSVDPLGEMAQKRKEVIEKQKGREQRNKKAAQFERAKTQQVVGKKAKDDISRTFALVSRSTASLGRFDHRLPGETEAPKMKGKRKTAGVGKSAGDFEAEKSGHLTIIDKMFDKESKLDTGRAASQAITREQRDKNKKNREELISGRAFKKPRH